MKVKLSDGREVKIQELKFKHFKKFINLIAQILDDLSKNELKVEKYADYTVELVSAMTSLSEEEIEELSASDALKLLRACIDQIFSDTSFLQELRTLIRKISEEIDKQTSGQSQKN